MKMSVTFTLEHRPGALVQALQVFSELGINLEALTYHPKAVAPGLYEFTLGCDCGGNAQFTADEQCTLARFRLHQKCKAVIRVFIDGKRMDEEGEI